MSIDASARARSVVRAGVVSLCASVFILALKLAGWWLTGSTALLADALESVVNVVAAGLVTYSSMFASRPADEDHPYGHGKAEFLSAGVEGTLIVVAAIVIVVEAVDKLLTGAVLTSLGSGMAIAAAAGCGNLALGAYLVRTGRKHRSDAIEADGRHVLADVITTAGSLVALAVILPTGWYWLDPLAGIVVALNILWTGWRIVRRALSGLLDEADFGSLHALAEALERERAPDWVDVHQLRTRRSGPLRHIDLHLVVPRYYSIDDAHRVAEGVERVLVETIGEEGDVVAHVDPCRPWQCAHCAVADCPMRSAELRSLNKFDVPWITRAGGRV